MPSNIYGVLSLIVWSLIIIVSIKYIIFIMRADNNGEGGILALLALILQKQRRDADSFRRKTIIALGLIGAALLYGDGVITPAISVLSAVEGLAGSARPVAAFGDPTHRRDSRAFFFSAEWDGGKSGGYSDP